MANSSEDEAKSTTVKQKSFVTSLKRLVLVPSSPISGLTWTVDRQQKALLNYWTAISHVLADGDDEVTVLFKTNGFASLPCRVACSLPPSRQSPRL